MRGGIGFIAATAGAVFMAAPAFAQQRIDEPRLDPIFGRRYEEPEPTYVKNDDEYDGNERLVGVMTFLTPEETNLSLGVGPVYRPDYFGSDDYKWDVDPAAFIRVKNFLFFDDDGADFALIGFSNFSFGPTIRIVGDRDENDNPALAGLGDVGTTFEFGGFAATTFVNRFSVRFKVRHGLKTGHRGTVVDASGTAMLFRWGPVSTSISGQAAWVGNRYADAYFTVTPDQSLSSGLPAFDANAGFRDIGGSVNGYINVRRNWSINPYISYRRIFEGIAETPIISQFGNRDQFTAGFHIMREFHFGGGDDD